MTSSTEGMESRALVVVLSIICTLAVASNVVVLLVIFTNKRLQGVTEAFMANMAVSDILLAGIAIPLKLNQAASGQEDFIGGDAACKLVMWLPMFTIMCSIFTMVAISFDRYFTIVRQRKLGRVGLTATILGIWLLSVAGSSPQFYEYSIYEHFEEKDNETEISCGSHGIAENFETIYASIVVFVAYFIPLIFIIYNYINLARFLWKVSAGGDGIQGTVSKKKVKIVKMLALVTAVFAICWAPFFILFTMEEVTGTDDTKNITSTSHSTKESFIAISTISNPILYLVLNDRFRSGAFRLITCGHYRGSAVENASVTLTRTAQSNS